MTPRQGPAVAAPGGVPSRLASLVLVALTLSALPLRRAAEAPPRREPCAVEGRGVEPRHWLGCAEDPGPRRALASDERIALALPLDPNLAGARALSFVPGLSGRLAAEVVRDREANGPYATVDELVRVRGVGPRRLARARAHLVVLHPW